MEIFQMNDYEWMAAADLESAKAEYLKTYAGGVSAEEAFDDPCEVDMDRLIFTEDDGTTLTFRAKLAQMIADGCTFPAYFASTEF